MDDQEKKGSNKNIFTIIILIAVGALIAYGMFGTVIKVENDTLKIAGLQGRKVQISEVKNVSIKNDLPEIISKTGGFSLAGKRLGNFLTTEYGKVNLYLFNSNPPFIYLEQNDGGIIIMNMNDSDSTSILFNDIKENINLLQY